MDLEAARAAFALHRYERCLELTGAARSSEALALAAQALDRLGRLAEAAAHYRRAQARSGRVAELAALEALAHGRAGSLAGLADALSRAKAALRGADAPTRALVAGVEAERDILAGDRDAALARLERAAGVAPGAPVSAWIAHRQAFAHARRGDLARAGEAALRAIAGAAHDPGHPLLAAAWRRLGVVRTFAIDFTGAAEALSRALQLARACASPLGEADGLRSLASLYRKLGRLGEAVALLALARERYRALGLTTREALAISETGHAHAARGELAPALAAYREDLALLEAAPEPERWRRARANVLRRVARVERWRSTPPWELKRDRSDPVGLAALAESRRLARAGGDAVGEALAWLEEGLAHGAAGDAAAAARALNRARPALVAHPAPLHLAALERLEARIALLDATGSRAGEPAGPARAAALLASAVARLEAGVPTLRQLEARIELAAVLDLLGRGPDAHEERVRAYRAALALDARAHVQALLGALAFSEPQSLIAPCLEVTDDALGLIGASAPMRELRERVRRAAARDVPVLVRGETGTGKTLVARAIHAASPRRGGRLLVINVASLGEGLVDSELFGHAEGAFTGAVRARPGAFRAAAGGTLVLDEIGDLPLAAQARLLHVLEEGQVRPLGEDLPVTVDARVVLATHRDLEAMVDAGTFRRDLLERIRRYEIRVPPLRERPADIPALARHALEALGDVRLSAAALEALVADPWPGNVRALRNALEAAAIDAGPGGTIAPAHLAREPRATARKKDATAPAGDLAALVREALDAGRPVLAELDRRVADHVLVLAGGNLSDAARMLGVHRNTLARLVGRWKTRRPL